MSIEKLKEIIWNIKSFLLDFSMLFTYANIIYTNKCFDMM